MNWDQFKGNWKQVRGKVKEKWGKLTDSDLDMINGRKDQLIRAEPGREAHGDGGPRRRSGQAYHHRDGDSGRRQSQK